MCAVLKVSRSGFYAWLERDQHPGQFLGARAHPDRGSDIGMIGRGERATRDPKLFQRNNEDLFTSKEEEKV